MCIRPSFVILLLIFTCILVLVSSQTDAFTNGWQSLDNNTSQFNMIDGVVYINLENRQDRKNLLLEELAKLGIDENRIHKVSGIYTPNNGHKGCVQSHILALTMAQLNKWNNVLILEDDAELTMDPNTTKEIFSKLIETIKTKNIDWNVIMLATAHSDKVNLDLDIPDNFIKKVKYATTSSAYIVNKDYIPKLLELYNHCNINMKPDRWYQKDYEAYALDQQWNKLQESDIWLCLDKDLFQQRNINSSIMDNYYKSVKSGLYNHIPTTTTPNN